MSRIHNQMYNGEAQFSLGHLPYSNLNNGRNPTNIGPQMPLQFNPQLFPRVPLYPLQDRGHNARPNPRNSRTPAVVTPTQAQSIPLQSGYLLQRGSQPSSSSTTLPRTPTPGAVITSHTGTSAAFIPVVDVSSSPNFMLIGTSRSEQSFILPQRANDTTSPEISQVLSNANTISGTSLSSGQPSALASPVFLPMETPSPDVWQYSSINSSPSIYCPPSPLSEAEINHLLEKMLEDEDRQFLSAGLKYFDDSIMNSNLSTENKNYILTILNSKQITNIQDFTNFIQEIELHSDLQLHDIKLVINELKRQIIDGRGETLRYLTEFFKEYTNYHALLAKYGVPELAKTGAYIMQIILKEVPEEFNKVLKELFTEGNTLQFASRMDNLIKDYLVYTQKNNLPLISEHAKFRISIILRKHQAYKTESQIARQNSAILVNCKTQFSTSAMYTTSNTIANESSASSSSTSSFTLISENPISSLSTNTNRAGHFSTIPNPAPNFSVQTFPYNRRLESDPKKIEIKKITAETLKKLFQHLPPSYIKTQDVVEAMSNYVALELIDYLKKGNYTLPPPLNKFTS